MYAVISPVPPDALGLMHAMFPLSRYAPLAPVGALHALHVRGLHVAAAFDRATWTALSCLDDDAGMFCVMKAAAMMHVGAPEVNHMFARAAAIFLDMAPYGVRVSPRRPVFGAITTADRFSANPRASQSANQRASRSPAPPPPPPPPPPLPPRLRAVEGSPPVAPPPSPEWSPPKSPPTTPATTQATTPATTPATTRSSSQQPGRQLGRQLGRQASFEAVHV